MTTPDRPEIVDALERWGSAPTPPPDPLFLARLGRRLADGTGAEDRHVTEVDLGRRADVVPLRRRAGLAAVAAAAVLTVAGAAAAVATRVVDDRVVPAAPVHGASTPPTSSSTAPVVPVPERTTLTVATPASPAVTPAARVTEPPATSTAPPAPTSAVPTTAPTAPVAGTEPVAPARPLPPASTAPTVPPTVPPTDPPATSAPPTTGTTEVRSPASMMNSCSAQAVDGQPAIVCEWSEPAGGAASYRVLRGIQGQSVGRVLTPVPGTRRYVDRPVTAGTTYLYTVQALDAGGVVLGHSTMAVVTP